MTLKHLKKGDILLIAAVILLSAILFLCLYVFNHNEGSFVRIEADGIVEAELPLNEDAIYNIEKAGGITNVVVIKDGYVSVSEADCPDKICVNHKKINKTGESIICLPNKVIVTVESNHGNETDGVVR